MALSLYVIGAMLVFTPAPVIAVTAVTLKAGWWLLKTGASAVFASASKPPHRHAVWTSSNTANNFAGGVRPGEPIRRTKSM